MLYNYLVDNYKNGEPIFLSELPGKSVDSIRQEMKKLTDEGKIERLYNGVYYLSYLTILGTKGKISVDKFIQKRFLEVCGKTSGYITGIQLANMYGFTTQNPSCYEVCSNEASTKQRKLNIGGIQIIVYKPVTDVSSENIVSLQFLDLMSTIDKYSEITNDELIELCNRDIKKICELSVDLKTKVTLCDKVNKILYTKFIRNENQKPFTFTKTNR